jgi:hypothetical protein
MNGNGLIITSDYGSFLDSLLSTSKTLSHFSHRPTPPLQLLQVVDVEDIGSAAIPADSK